VRRASGNAGFTIVELLFVTAIIATLAAIALPVGSKQIDNARIQRTIVEIRTLEKEITEFQMNAGTYPMALTAIGRGGLLDPWGNPYEYQNIADTSIPQGQMRKDRFLVPVNSDYDLYSRGKDGATQKPFTAAKARDDIVRASNGQYVGLAEDF
jgi:general secretion pathway protein G